MEDDLNFLKKEDDLKFLKMENDLKKTMQPKTIIYLIMEADLNFFEKGRWPQLFVLIQKQLQVKQMVVAPLRVT